MSKWPPADKPLASYTSKELTRLILGLVAVGALVVALPVLPGVGLAIKFYKDATAQEKRKLTQKVRDLNRYGYLEKRRNIYVITKKGRRYLTEDEVWNMNPQKPKRWDGRMHLVLFDIPGKKERARQALRARLIELGFKRFQNSVYVNQYDMLKALYKFTEFYGIKSHVKYATVESLH